MILYLDCASGVSGDMLVAALLGVCGARSDDAGPLDDVVRPALAAAGIDPRLVSLREERRGGLAASAFVVAGGPGFATFDELIVSIRASNLEQPVADAVASLAERLAAAEAEVHGREGEHAHELSGVDTAVDLVATCALLQRLRPERVVASPPALGDGTVDTAHGELAVPAPAVLSLLTGLPTAGGSGAPGDPPLGELTTPTGAALLAHFVEEFGGVPAGRVELVGYGAGSREVPGRPNVLRAVLVDPRPAAAAPASTGAIPGDHVLLETNVDDMSPELLAHAADAVREAGAVDVWLSQALMKKGRPGAVMHVLAEAGDSQRLADVVFAETSSFGLRLLPVGRLYQEERRETVAVGRQDVRVRLGYVGERLVTVSPEYEDVRRVAAAVGRPVKVVFEAAQAAARARFNAP